MTNIELTPEEIKTVYAWFRVYRHEVDIDPDSYHLFMQKIAPSLPDDLMRGAILTVKEQYENQIS